MDRVSSLTLAMLRDPDQMRTFFQAWLAPEEPRAVVVESCEIDFVREASARSLLQYTLQVRETNSGASSAQVVTGVAYAGDRGATVRQQLQQASAGVTNLVLGRALPAWTYVPDLQTVFQLYPFDFRLPAMAHLLNGPPPALLSAVLAEWGSGEWDPTQWQAEVVRYRVDMRAMVRLEVQAQMVGTERAISQRLYAKIYRERAEASDAFTLQRALWEQTRSDDFPLAVARPIAYLPDLRTLLLEEAPGRRLLAILRSEDTALPAVLRAARALAALHQLPLDDALATRQRVARDDASRLPALAASLEERIPGGEEQVREVVTSIAAGLPEAPLAPTHFDLKPGHILIDGDRVTLLDFDKLAAADPLVDVTGLVATLGKERGATREQAGQAQALARAFITEYFSHVPAAWYARFPARYALALLTEASTTGRGLRGRAEKASRANRMATLVQQAHAAVTQHVW